MKKSKKNQLTKLVLLTSLTLSLSNCFLFQQDNEPACRPCYATLGNGEVMEVETCSAKEEEEFMTEYRNFNPTCR